MVGITPASWFGSLTSSSDSRSSDRRYQSPDRTSSPSPRTRFERLLRSSQIPTGILWNGEALRLVYAPRGESSGHLTFPLAAMGEVAGRLILGALDTLLNAQRMFNGSSDRRLPQILASSRDYQSAVSEQLAEQVVDALWELLRGFQIADGAANRRLLGGSPLAPCLVHLVGEPTSSSSGEETSPSRIPNSGGTGMENPPSLGDFQKLAPPELGAGGQIGSTLPQIPDGVIYRVLDKLLMLDGERLSYRSPVIDNSAESYHRHYNNPE